MYNGRSLERKDDDPSVRRQESLPPEYKAVLNLRRRGVGYDDIAEQLGYENRFEVIDILNRIYRNVKPINVEETRDTIESQIDDLTTVYMETALLGNDKAAKFVLAALKLKAQIRGAILPPQMNIQISGAKPWEKVYATTLSNVDEKGEIIEGDVVEDGEEETFYY